MIVCNTDNYYPIIQTIFDIPYKMWLTSLLNDRRMALFKRFIVLYILTLHYVIHNIFKAIWGYSLRKVSYFLNTKNRLNAEWDLITKAYKRIHFLPSSPSSFNILQNWIYDWLTCNGRMFQRVEIMPFISCCKKSSNASHSFQ